MQDIKLQYPMENVTNRIRISSNFSENIIFIDKCLICSSGESWIDGDETKNRRPPVDRHPVSHSGLPCPLKVVDFIPSCDKIYNCLNRQRQGFCKEAKDLSFLADKEVCYWNRRFMITGGYLKGSWQKLVK